jgi:integrase
VYTFIRTCSRLYASSRSPLVHKLHVMATIAKQPSGTWRAIVRRKAQYASRTLRLRVDAEGWARQIEHQIDRGQSLVEWDGRFTTTIGDLINLHIADMIEVGRPALRSKQYCLEKLASTLGNLQPRDMTRGWLLEYGKRRAREGAGPVTLNMEIAYLRTVFTHAAAVHGLPIVIDQIVLARAALKQLGLIGKGVERARRPTQAELDRIILYCASNPRQFIPIGRIVKFAVATAMRQDEITRIEWTDLDESNRLVTVRDRKDPRRKRGNHQRVPLLSVTGYDPIELIEEQARAVGRKGRIFPYNGRSIGAAFRRACKHLEIVDLHFHDLRHEGTSRLFEAGLTIPEVALITGHKDWKMLARYVNLRPEQVAAKLRPVQQ